MSSYRLDDDDQEMRYLDDSQALDDGEVLFGLDRDDPQATSMLVQQQPTEGAGDAVDQPPNTTQNDVIDLTAERDVNEARLAAIRSAPVPTAAGKLCGVYARLHPGKPDGTFDVASLDILADGLFEPERKLEIEYDDIERMTSDPEACVKGVYDAISSAPANQSEKIRKGLETFTKKFTNINDDIRSILVQQLAAQIVRSIIELHERGDNLRADQLRELRLTDNDKSMSAYTRYRAVCVVLREYKLICPDILDGKGEIVKLVAGPWSAKARKIKNMDRSGA